MIQMKLFGSSKVAPEGEPETINLGGSGKSGGEQTKEQVSQLSESGGDETDRGGPSPDVTNEFGFA